MTTLEKTLKGEDLFDALDPESRQEKDRNFEVHENALLKEICNNYEEWVQSQPFFNQPFFRNLFPEVKEYKSALKLFKDKYSAVEILEFVTHLPFYEKRLPLFDRAGIFISALINNSPDIQFYLNFSCLKEKLDYVGYRNLKEIMIIGDLGNKAGYEMKSGKIFITGNAGDRIGKGMLGGEITIDGRVGESVGYNMMGGKIIVKGNTGDNVGSHMRDWMGGREMRCPEIIIEGNAGENIGIGTKGGKIYLNGNFKSISPDYDRGVIYHKNKLVQRRRHIFL